MWGDKIRTSPDGAGIPKIKKLSWTRLGRIRESGESWDVTYPDSWEFDCCSSTDAQMFDTWAAALSFALARNWEK